MALFFPLVSFALAPEDPVWKALLHISSSESSISDKIFFLSPLGSKDAAQEWLATKQFLQSPEGSCRYPARALYFGVPEGKGPLCDRWKKWKSAIAAKGVEVVFASSFLNSPSSMYGHTLLKFSKGGDELLDYALSYGANTEDSGGLAYVWKGLTGAFSGEHATSPFYLKVKEYDHGENRDFWIYPLRLSPQEVELLVAHAWELRNVQFPYYFLQKNCSYYLLEFLRVARPEADILDFPFWAIPLDTIRRLDSLGMVAEPRHRPSRQKLLRERKKNLSALEQKLVGDLVAGEESVLPAGKEAFLLDTALELAKFRKADNTKILERRAKFLPAAEVSIVEPNPLLGHKTSALFLGAGGGSKPFAEFSYRPALHDLMAPSLGYEPHTELVMGESAWRWQNRKFFLERFDLLRIRSLAPWENWFPNKSWQFHLGARKDSDCYGWHCLRGELLGGIGASAIVSSVHIFGLWDLGLQAGNGSRIFTGPNIGLSLDPWRGGTISVEAERSWKILGDRPQNFFKATVGQMIGRDQLIGEGHFQKNYREISGKLVHYF